MTDERFRSIGIRRVLLAPALAALFLAAPAEARSAPTFSLDEGKTLEKTSVKMKSVRGPEISVEDAAGKKGTLVYFTCNHCPYVKAWEDRMVALGNTYRREGIGVIAINANDPSAFPSDGYEAMQERAKEKGMKFPYVVDATSDVAREFGATKTPEAFLFDADGNLVYHGTIDDNVKDAAAVEKAWLKDALEAVVNGEPVPEARTKALGCSIKFRSQG